MNTRSPWQRPACALTVAATVLMIGIAPAVAGQNETRLPTLRDDPDAAPWQEGEVPPPPAFSVDKLVPFEAMRGSELNHGIAPDTVAVSPDGVVRYVRVANNPQGTLNAVYEGVRCNSAEVRSYAYWNASSQQWQNTPKNPWRALDFGAATQPAKVLAREALCDGPTPNGTSAKILRDLRYGKKP